MKERKFYRENSFDLTRFFAFNQKFNVESLTKMIIIIEIVLLIHFSLILQAPNSEVIKRQTFFFGKTLLVGNLVNRS